MSKDIDTTLYVYRMIDGKKTLIKSVSPEEQVKQYNSWIKEGGLYKAKRNAIFDKKGNLKKDDGHVKPWEEDYELVNR